MPKPFYARNQRTIPQAAVTNYGLNRGKMRWTNVNDVVMNTLAELGNRATTGQLQDQVSKVMPSDLAKKAVKLAKDHGIKPDPEQVHSRNLVYIPR